MRKITFKRYYGTAEQVVPHAAYGVRTSTTMQGFTTTYDHSWVHVREGFFFVTNHVPWQFDVAYRYLRLHGLAKFVHDFSPWEPNGWGWFLKLHDDKLTLAYHSPTPSLDEPVVSITGPIGTRRERRQTIRAITQHLMEWRDRKFRDPNLGKILQNHARNLWIIQRDYAKDHREYDDLTEDEHKALILTAKIFHGHSLLHRVKI